MPSADQLPRYRLADLLVDVGRRIVVRGETEIHLGKLSFELLKALIEGAPNVVSNEQLCRRVWQGVVVSPETVTQRVKLLRDALGDDPEAPRYIAGLRGQGYRLLPPATMLSGVAPATTSEAGDSPPAQTGRRRVGIVLGATALAVVLAYFTVDQLLISKHGEASERATATGRVNSTSPTPAVFAPPSHSLAVLPFVNMSGDPGEEYFSDGLSEELLDKLSRIRELRVAARTSSFSFKGKDTDIGTIARRLNVGAVLEGSVRRSQHTVRVTAQLNDAVTGFHLWSQTYDRGLGDILTLQTEIADAVAGALKITLLKDDTARIELGSTSSPTAFDAYLRASRAYRTSTDLGPLQTAIAAYTEAIRLDPNYALAFAGRSLALTDFAGHHAVPATIRESFDRAREDARRAIALSPELGEAHLALAKLLLYDSLDFTRAGEEFERAVALAPGNTRVLRTYGRFAADMGRSEAGIAAARAAALLDPLNPTGYRVLGFILYESRHYNEAIAAAQNSLAVDSDNPDAYAIRGLAYYGLGDFKSARSSCEISANYSLSRICLALSNDKLGRRAEARAELEKLQALGGEAAAYQYAEICAQWGKIDAALKWLETAVRIRDPGLGWLKVDPLLEPLRGEPRFQAIERALKFPT